MFVVKLLYYITYKKVQATVVVNILTRCLYCDIINLGKFIEKARFLDIGVPYFAVNICSEFKNKQRKGECRMKTLIDLLIAMMIVLGLLVLTLTVGKWVALVGLLLSIVWFIKSLKVIGPDEVALMVVFGKIIRKIFRSGLMFLPYFPGVRLIRITTKQLPLRYEGKLEHRVWSGDRQGLLVDVTGAVRFPFNELDSLILMVQSGVPLDQAGLQEWAEDETISGLKDIAAGFTLEESLSKSNITAINAAAMAFFLRPDGLFAKSGICGNNPTNFEPGTGEVILRIEQINPTEKIQKAMELTVSAKYEANAARETARMNAEEVGTQIITTVALLSGVDIDDPAKLKAFKEKINTDPTLRSKPASDGGYKEVFDAAIDQLKRDRSGAQDIRVGNADGTAMNGELPAFAAAALLLNRGGGRGGDGRKNKEKLSPLEWHEKWKKDKGF